MNGLGRVSVRVGVFFLSKHLRVFGLAHPSGRQLPDPHPLHLDRMVRPGTNHRPEPESFLPRTPKTPGQGPDAFDLHVLGPLHAFVVHQSHITSVPWRRRGTRTHHSQIMSLASPPELLSAAYVFVLFSLFSFCGRASSSQGGISPPLEGTWGRAKNASRSVLCEAFFAKRSSPRAQGTPSPEPTATRVAVSRPLLCSSLEPDRNRTDSRRSEPNSRSALPGEHPDPWDLVQPQDALSRHRGAEPSRR